METGQTLLWNSPTISTSKVNSSIVRRIEAYSQQSTWPKSRQISLLLLLFCSVAQLCPNLCIPFTISQSLLKLMFIESMMLSNHFILCCPLFHLPSIFPSIRVFSNESALCVTWQKYWSFSFGISPSSEYSGLISFRMDWFDLLADQGTLKSLLQHHLDSISFSVLSLIYGPTLRSIHDYWENHSSDYMDLCQQNNVSAF